MAITIFHLFFTASSSAAAASFLAASRVSTGLVGSCARAVVPLSKSPNSTVLASMRAYIGMRPPFLWCVHALDHPSLARGYARHLRQRGRPCQSTATDQQPP